MAQRRVNKEQSTTDHTIGQAKEATMPVDGDAKMERSSSIEVVDGPNAMGKADALAFNEEKVGVMVHESTNPADQVMVFTSVNGRRQYFIRGQQQLVKRKFVECLARAKKTGYKQVVTVNEATGNVVQKMVPHTALKYPFSIVEDKNPNGSAWLRQILNEA